MKKVNSFLLTSCGIALTEKKYCRSFVKTTNLFHANSGVKLGPPGNHYSTYGLAS
jgi:hypothetical protein